MGYQFSYSNLLSTPIFNGICWSVGLALFHFSMHFIHQTRSNYLSKCYYFLLAQLRVCRGLILL